MSEPRNLFTELPYLYRDASNYKVSGVIFLEGVLSPADIEMIEAKCEDGDGFIPFDLGLGIDELQDQLESFPGDDDHVFHEFDFEGLSLLKALPEGQTSISVNDFLLSFSKIEDSNSWNIADAEARLGIGSEMESVANLDQHALSERG